MIKLFFKNIAKNIYWSIYGKTIYNPVFPSHINSILFVCKGNICRSPFAEYFASKYFSVSNSLLYYSAGIKVEYPKPPPIEAIVSARNFGIDLDGHMSREINYNLVEKYDVIIVMETWQYNYLNKIYQEFRNKIFCLPLFESYNEMSYSSYNLYNIKDPYGKNVAEFDESFSRIKRCLEGLFSIINKDEY